MKLLPIPSFRFCPLPACGRRWFTASPAAQPCPYCGTAVHDASSGWPHGCAQGHSTVGPGECKQCAPVRVEEPAVAGVKTWNDRATNGVAK